MKHISTLAIAALSLLLVTSCKPEEEEVKLDITVENISGNWEEKDVTIDGHKYNSEGSSTYDLRADGTFHYTNIEKAYDGTWTVDGTVFSISHPDGNGTIHANYDIDKLTNRTLVLSQKGGASTTYKRK